MEKSNSESSGRGKYGYSSPPLRMMQWNLLSATAIGKYRSDFRPDAKRGRSFVSRSGTQHALDGWRQCNKVKSVPVES